MKDNPIKVIKRDDLTKIADANSLKSHERKPLTGRQSRREIVATISTWVSESKENSRAARLDAIRKYFGKEPVVGLH